MRSLILLIIAVLVVVVLLVSRILPENVIGSVVAPGLLSRVHADYDDDCSRCHSPLRNSSQNALCISCHEHVSADFESGEGFHGISPAVREKQCKSCHSEHLGRDVCIVPYDKGIFNHDYSDFPLVGAHAGVDVSCDACHKEGEKFRLAPGDCMACHSTDDEHDGSLGSNCAGCHKETTWAQTSFDHDSTCFALDGKHRSLSCDACHANASYNSASIHCNSCHLMDDIHSSPLDVRCQACHDTEGWQNIEFNHNIETGFTLTDAHTELSCAACHIDSDYKTELGMECADCHTFDDRHKGVYGRKCTDCHSLVDWTQVAFDHDKDTEYILSGKHRDVECEACHKESIQNDKGPATCDNCHHTDDIHKENLGAECDSCHNTGGWNAKIAFEHDITRFPLIGIHAVTACGECHLSSVFKGTEIACMACHESDDSHKGTLGDQCGQCHNPNGWRLWEFDHNTQTKFVADGGHKDLECRACHKSPVRENADRPRTCSACHSGDNVHSRKFSRECNKCHTTKSFRQIKVGR